MEPAKLGAYIPVSHDALCDYTDHQCTADCPPPYVAPKVPWLRRTGWAIRNRVRRITGLRLAHKDRIDQERDTWLD